MCVSSHALSSRYQIIFLQVTPVLWFHFMKPLSCHLSGTSNLDMAARLTENLWILVRNIMRNVGRTDMVAQACFTWKKTRLLPGFQNKKCRLRWSFRRLRTGLDKTDSVHTVLHWDVLVQPLLQWKSS